jgi:hypothetical protein
MKTSMFEKFASKKIDNSQAKMVKGGGDGCLTSAEMDSACRRGLIEGWGKCEKVPSVNDPNCILTITFPNPVSMG